MGLLGDIFKPILEPVFRSFYQAVGLEDKPVPKTKEDIAPDQTKKTTIQSVTKQKAEEAVKNQTPVKQQEQKPELVKQQPEPQISQASQAQPKPIEQVKQAFVKPHAIPLSVKKANTTQLSPTQDVDSIKRQERKDAMQAKFDSKKELASKIVNDFKNDTTLGKAAMKVAAIGEKAGQFLSSKPSKTGFNASAVSKIDKIQKSIDNKWASFTKSIETRVKKTMDGISSAVNNSIIGKAAKKLESFLGEIINNSSTLKGISESAYKKTGEIQKKIDNSDLAIATEIVVKEVYKQTGIQALKPVEKQPQSIAQTAQPIQETAKESGAKTNSVPQPKSMQSPVVKPRTNSNPAPQAKTNEKPLVIGGQPGINFKQSQNQGQSNSR